MGGRIPPRGGSMCDPLQLTVTGAC